MTVTEDVAAVTWDLGHLVGGQGDGAVDGLMDEADRRAAELSVHRGKVGQLDAAGLAELMAALGELREVLGKAESYAGLRFSEDTTDAAAGALMQRVEERSARVETELIFFDLEWAALPDERVEELLADPRLAFCRHHLATLRRYREHLLSEPEERILTEKAVTGWTAWTRLFGELTSSLDVELDGQPATLEEALSRLHDPSREVRRTSAEAVTAALAPGLRTRAYIFNTLLQDKAVDDRLRRYPHWLTSRNLSNEASDESVEALVAAVRDRYDLPRRWYRVKARLLGLDRVADYDRLASVAEEEPVVPWSEAREVVLDCYDSFSGQLADVARRFLDGGWVDAPARPGKRPGAFCAYTVPSVHPYVLLNYTSRRSDVLTLAHELGHGLHAYLAAPQGVFHQSTPLTMAETASVFGETVVFGRLLDLADSPASRLALLAQNVEGALATVFRQTAMNRFEESVHTARRQEGELSVERMGELWAESQAELLGDAVEITEGYLTWWSYIPHFIGTPGYVYAYAYGQLLALSVYRRYQDEGPGFVPRYLELLAAGGSDSPEALGRLVGCDLADPGFWRGGLAIVESQIEAAEAAAREAGRLS
ncbi:MAG: M3 family oligoendopeptidase [Actinobacteria bacterium]|nr:MAG: M3 family oligoendopeptidase [Actinomycetota bacterium]